MTPQLFSVEHAPLHLPYWRSMMDDLCNPPASRVARVLGLSVRSVHRYNATGHAPRHVCLAVFWLTRWGRSAVHAQATNDATLMASYVSTLTRHAEALSSQVEHLLSIGNFGSANEPTHHHRSTRHALPDLAANDPEPTLPSEQLPALLAHLSRLHQARAVPVELAAGRVDE